MTYPNSERCNAAPGRIPIDPESRVLFSQHHLNIPSKIVHTCKKKKTMRHCYVKVKELSQVILLT